MEKNIEINSEFYTLKKAAQLLRFTNLSMWRMLHRGEIPGFRVGARWRVKKDFVDNMKWNITDDKKEVDL